MAETQIKKLNLRALKTDNETAQSEETKTAWETTVKETQSAAISMPEKEENLQTKTDSLEVQAVPKISLKMLQKTDNASEAKSEEKKEEKSAKKPSKKQYTVEENQVPKKQEKEKAEEVKVPKISLSQMREKKEEPISTLGDSDIKNETSKKTEKKDDSKVEKKSEVIIKKEEKSSSDTVKEATNDSAKVKVKKELKKEEESEIDTDFNNTISATASKEQKDVAKEFLEKINKEAEQESIEKEEKWKPTEDSNPNEGVVFANYESKFKKQSSNVLKRIQNFRYAPKTRVWMLFWLIWCTVCVIATLMVLLPEKHSVNVYKASILEIYQDYKNPSEDIPPAGEVHETDTPEVPENEAEVEEVDTPIVPEKEIIKKEKQKERIKEHILQKYKS